MRRQPALKDAECDICHVKFKKQGFTRHRNSCQAKKEASNKKKIPMFKP